MSQGEIDQLGFRVRELERQLAQLTIEGTPNLRDRVELLETRVNHLVDPERGVYPEIHRATERLRTWAIVLLTALIMNLALVLIHLISTGEGP